MRLGIFAKTFAGADPEAVLGAAKAAGYQAVQYNMACSGLPSLPAAISPAQIDAVAKAAQRQSIEIAAVSATYNMIHPDMNARIAGRESFTTIAEAARAMGTQLVTVCTGSCDADDQWQHHPDNASPEAWHEMCLEFEHLLAVADRTDTLIGVEPELANVISSASRARRLLDTFKTDRIRIVLDPANLFEVETLEEQRTVLDTAADLLAGSIALAHAKDRYADGSFATAGKGVVDWPYYIRALRRAGFDGALVTHGLDAREAVDVAIFLEAQLEG